MIRDIEQHTFEAVPASETELYDGWVLRASHSQAKRTNSVNFLDMGNRPIDEKIAYCEAFYKARNKPCHFRITPLASPENIDVLLRNQGYQILDPTDILMCDLINVSLPKPEDVQIEMTPSEEWLRRYGELENLSDETFRGYVENLNLIQQPSIFAHIRTNGVIVAVGHAVIHNGIIGLFEFVTDPVYKRQGLARRTAHALMQYGKNQDCHLAYLQVTQTNTAGQQFWQAVGFTESLYTYYYLTKD